MKRILHSITLAAFVSAAFLITSCSKEEKPVLADNDYYSISLNSVEPSDIPEFTTQTWHITNKKILVFFGYNFNSNETTARFLQKLSERYGLAESGGLIYPVIYPDQFKHTKSFYTELFNLLADSAFDFDGLITLGAPENTYIALAKHQDFWNQECPFPVIALFPQDDVLGVEATCDFVLDKAQNAQLNGDLVKEEEEVSAIKEAPEVLLRTIDYLLTEEVEFEKNSSLQTHLKQILKEMQFHHYLDSETGLQSVNHFVLN